MTSGYMAVLFIFSSRMPFLKPTLDTADTLFVLGITTDFYLPHVAVANQDPASGNQYVDQNTYIVIQETEKCVVV